MNREDLTALCGVCHRIHSNVIAHQRWIRFNFYLHLVEIGKIASSPELHSLFRISVLHCAIEMTFKHVE